MKRKNRILVVDPDTRTHALCAEVFTADKNDVLFAHTAAEALTALRDTPVTVLITEITLDGAHGLALVAHARRGNPACVVVVLTSEPSAATAVRALRADVDDYVFKHADSVGHLSASVRAALRKRAREGEVQRLLEQLTELNEAFLSSLHQLRRENLQLTEQLERPQAADAIWTMLVVDDDVAVVALLETLLRSQGFSVEGANSGAEARRLLAANTYDLVLTDKNLGDANGLDLVREIRANSPQTRVLVMTGFATVDSAVEAIHTGAAGYLRKPFEDLSVVVNRVDEVLDDIGQTRAEQRYMQAIAAQNQQFVTRYRMLKQKLETLQKSRP